VVVSLRIATPTEEDDMTTTTRTTPASPARRIEVPALPSRRRTPRRLLVGVGVLLTGSAAAVAIGMSSGSDAAPREPVPVVEDGRWGGPDVYEPQGDPPQRYGSADVLERLGQF
jgi:hypothetical protein